MHKFQSFVKLLQIISATMNLPKTQLHKIGQSGVFLCRVLGSLLETRLPLIGNVFRPLAKNVLML